MAGLILLALAQGPQAMRPLEGEESDLLAHAEEVPQSETATSASSLVVYAILRCDAVFETAQTNFASAPSYALHPDLYDPANSFLMTPRDSRVGLLWRSASDPNLTGEIEYDLSLDLQKGFLQYRRDTWAVRAGQDWDIFGARKPDMLNFEYFRMAGNVGYKRPAVRFDLPTGQGGRLSAAVGAPGWYDPWPLENTGMPDVQARFSLQKGALEWGVSSVLGARKDPIADEDYRLWGICGDVSISLGELGTTADPWIVAAELWFGENLASYMGGVGQGVYSDEEVAVIGGWLGVRIPIIHELAIRIGYGFDDPLEKRLPDDYLPIELNRAFWAGVRWTPLETLEVGAELNLLFTEYPDDPMTGFDESAHAKATSVRIVGAARF